MYLEERVGQLENLSVDHGRQIEIIAKGVADLTVTVNERFDQVDRRFDEVNEDIAQLKSGQIRLETAVTDLQTGQVRLETTVTDIQQTQQLILTLLQDRLK